MANVMNDAQASESNKTKLHKVNNQIQTVKQNIALNQSKLDSINHQLKNAEETMGTLDRDLRGINKQLDKKNKALNRLYQTRDKYQDQLAKQHKNLNQAITNAYVISQQSTIKVLLNEEDPNEISRMLHYYQYINHAQLSLMVQTKDTLTEINQTTQAIEAKKVALKQLQNQKQHKRSQLKSLQKHRNKLVSTLNNNINSGQGHLKELESNRAQLEKLLNSFARTYPSKFFAHSKGKLIWPTKGSITKSFDSTIKHSQIKLNGVIIRAPEGQNVYAIAPGRVVFANWLRGYGLLLIVDHGDGYMTLYGYNQSLYKKTGDQVQAGELLATVGDSGGQAQSGLYFGVRRNGKPLNPQVWCKASGPRLA